MDTYLKKQNIIFTTTLALLFTACTSDVIKENGHHFQGRDCLSCHNVDLENEKHLGFGGSVFTTNALDPDDKSTYCNKPLFVQFLDSNGDIAFDSNDTNKLSDPGFKGVGNFFTLIRNDTVPSGSYTMRVYASDGTTIKQSSNTSHTFTSKFDKDNPQDSNNRYSCNACHSIGGSKGLIVSNQCDF